MTRDEFQRFGVQALACLVEHAPRPKLKLVLQTLGLVAVAAVSASADSLSEGFGLSAKYPRDDGIARDPHVLLAEDFESGGIDELGKRWNDVSNKDGKVLAFSDDVPAASDGKHSLQVTATLGENTGGHLYEQLAKGVDTVFARFY